MSSVRQEFANIYDEFRDAELNKDYYADRISRTRRKLRRIDIFLAAFGAGSAVLSWALWKNVVWGVHVGQTALGIFTGFATLVLIAKPYLKLEDEVERLSGIQSTYASISHALKDIVLRLKTEHAVSPESRITFTTLRQIRGSLMEREDKPADRKLIGVKQAEINARYPVSYFYYPED